MAVVSQGQYFADHSQVAYSPCYDSQYGQQYPAGQVMLVPAQQLQAMPQGTFMYVPAAYMMDGLVAGARGEDPEGRRMTSGQQGGWKPNAAAADFVPGGAALSAAAPDFSLQSPTVAESAASSGAPVEFGPAPAPARAGEEAAGSESDDKTPMPAGSRWAQGPPKIADKKKLPESPTKASSSETPTVAEAAQPAAAQPSKASQPARQANKTLSADTPAFEPRALVPTAEPFWPGRVVLSPNAAVFTPTGGFDSMNQQWGAQSALPQQHQHSISGLNLEPPPIAKLGALASNGENPAEVLDRKFHAVEVQRQRRAQEQEAAAAAARAEQERVEQERKKAEEAAKAAEEEQRLKREAAAKARAEEEERQRVEAAAAERRREEAAAAELARKQAEEEAAAEAAAEAERVAEEEARQAQLQKTLDEEKAAKDEESETAGSRDSSPGPGVVAPPADSPESTSVCSAEVKDADEQATNIDVRASGNAAEDEDAVYYSVQELLRYKGLDYGETPDAVSNLTIGVDDKPRGLRPGQPAINRRHTGGLRPGASPSGGSMRESMFGTRMGRAKTEGNLRRQPTATLPESSANAYKISAPKSREEKLERQVRSLLNKIAPENLDTIASRMEEIELENATEMTQVIKIILGKALDEPHYSATYGDMVAVLADKYPAFPAETEDDKPQTLQRLLLNATQEQYEALPRTAKPTPEQKEKFGDDTAALDEEITRQRKRVRAMVHFIGNLYIRKLLVTKVVQALLKELAVPGGKKYPEELEVDCACDLMSTIGFTLDSEPKGKVMLDSIVGRMKELQKSGKYSTRCLCVMMDTLDLRANGWRMKAKREVAKTLKEVGESAKHKNALTFETVIAGARPKHVAAKPAKGAPVPSPTSKPKVDAGKVIRYVQYFAEDHDGDALAQEWRDMNLSPEGICMAVQFILEKAVVGSLSRVAEALKCLVDAELITREIIFAEIATREGKLEDIILDCPKAPEHLEAIKAAVS
mmetsp:Transcript_13305/g.30163  ORF Transcript_13305/g.30163 Transcript_13305/m.30163 type:complete len:988 (+) Transcript_13305:108-3071(+)